MEATVHGNSSPSAKTPLKERNSDVQADKMESNTSFNFGTNHNINQNHNNNNNKDQTFDSSMSSSPFISNPELPITDALDENSIVRSIENDLNHDSDEFSESEEDHIPSNNGMITSPFNNGIMNSAELNGDLASPDYDHHNQSVVVHNNDSNSTFHESTVDTTKFNDTRAQFDQDFDFSPRKLNPISILPNPQSNPVTPWRRLRTASTYTPTKSQNNVPQPDTMMRLPSSRQSLFPSTANHIDAGHVNSASETHATTVSKIADLNKQIGSYRIQIQLFKEFLQKIIDKHVINKEVLDENELANFQRNLQGLSPARSTTSSDYAVLEDEYNKLLTDHQEVVAINNEIIDNLQDFEGKLHDKDLHIAQLNHDISLCSTILDEIISNMLKDPHAPAHSRDVLQDLFTTSDTIPLVNKLEVLKQEFENFSLPSPPPSSNGDDNKHKPVIDNLIATVNDLQLKLANQKSEKDKLEELRKDIDDSQSLKRNFQFMSSKFIELCQTFNENGEGDDLLKLQEENERISQELEESKRQWENQIQAVEDGSKLKSEVEELQQHNLRLIEEVGQSKDAFDKLKEESAAAITSISSQLQARQKEIVGLRNEIRGDQKLRDDVEVAVEMQRKLKAENIKLSYALDSYKEREASLKTTIESLTQKLTVLEGSGYLSHSQSEDSTGDINEYQKYLNHQLHEIFYFDTQEFNKLIKTFNKIADDSSLKDPIKKYDILMKKISSQDISKLDQDNLEFLRECHKSVFNFFVRAIDILVNNHIRLLLKESDHEGKEEYIKDLHQRINELMNDRSVLAKQIELYDQQVKNATHDTSPIAKLRLEEVQIKWKMEREKRAYEFKESQKRFKELEIENARLREMLSRQ